MTPSERRIAMIRLLAEIDQKIELAKAKSANPFLTDEERRFAEANAEFQRRAASHTERLLASTLHEPPTSDS